MYTPCALICWICINPTDKCALQVSASLSLNGFCVCGKLICSGTLQSCATCPGDVAHFHGGHPCAYMERFRSYSYHVASNGSRVRSI